MPETMSHDAYLLDDDNHDGNDDQLDGLKERLRAYRDAAGQLLAAWEKGDLAAAVRSLAALLDSATNLPDGFWEDKAERLGFALTRTAHGERWVVEGDDEPTRHETARKAVESTQKPQAAKEAYAATVDAPPGATPCACDDCDWSGPFSALAAIGDCTLTPGDSSPAGRCPACSTLAYVTPRVAAGTDGDGTARARRVKDRERLERLDQTRNRKPPPRGSSRAFARGWRDCERGRQRNPYAGPPGRQPPEWAEWRAGHEARAEVGFDYAHRIGSGTRLGPFLFT